MDPDCDVDTLIISQDLRQFVDSNNGDRVQEWWGTSPSGDAIGRGSPRLTP